MTGVHRGASQDVPLCFVFYFLDAVARGEQRFGAVVPPHCCARCAIAQAAQAALCLLGLVAQ